MIAKIVRRLSVPILLAWMALAAFTNTSVPPLEKTTAVVSAPTRSATRARAVSTRARARRPAECTALGLPPSARASAIAA